jgi:hypothetical protein
MGLLKPKVLAATMGRRKGWMEVLELKLHRDHQDDSRDYPLLLILQDLVAATLQELVRVLLVSQKHQTKNYD